MIFTPPINRISRLSLLLLPAAGIAVVRLSADPSRILPLHTFHDVAAGVGVLAVALLGYLAYKSHQKEGTEFLAYLALACLGFAILFAPQAVLTRFSDHNQALLMVFGPVSRLVLASSLLAGLLRLSRASGRGIDLRPHLLLLALLVAGVGLITILGWWVHLRWVEALAFLVTLAGVAITLDLKVRSSLLESHLTAQVFFAQSSLAFLFASPWDSLWWLAHAISAAGFLVLGYQIVATGGQVRLIDRISGKTVVYGLLDRIMETSPVGFLLTDAAFTPVRANRAAHKMLGIDRDLPSGEHLLTRLGLSPEALTARPGEVTATFSYEVQGRTQFYEARISPVEPDRPGQGYLCIILDTTEAQRAKAELCHMAYHDALTGLPNRQLLFDLLDLLLALAARNGRIAAVLMLDLDGFKAVNDRFGHDAGDEVLRTVARRLRESLRESDAAARLSGDEFVIVLPEIASQADAAVVAQKLLDRIAEPIDYEGRHLHVTASIGIGLYAGGELCKHRLLKEADAAMYQAKARGRNAYVFHETP